MPCCGPFSRRLTLPLTCLTFGLFAFVVNALLFWLVGAVRAGLPRRGLAAPLFGSVVMGLVGGLLNNVLVSKRERERTLMQLVVITGMSGAGKATAAKVFEDMAYTVVDNLPPILLPELVEKCLAAGEQPPGERLAVVIDARSGSFLVGLEPALTLVRQAGVRPTVLFLDASDGVLVQRFKETRRKHPLFEDHGGILGSVRAERALLEDIKEGADKVVDTSDMDAPELRNLLLSEFAPAPDKNQGLIVTVNSFGFKYGLPLDADLVFDVRFLVNPHYVDDLRPYDGRNQIIEEYRDARPGQRPVFGEAV